MAVASLSRVVSLLALAAVISSGCGKKVTNSAPRVSSIPAQVAPSGATFNLDLSTYVTDREGDPLVYGVVNGGGSFATSTYSRVFPSLGEFTVDAQVTDTGGKITPISFTVKVKTANLAVLTAGSNLLLVDQGTANTSAPLPAGDFYSESFHEVTGAQGVVHTFKASLAQGQVVYERVLGGQTDLFVYDPTSKQTLQLGTDPGMLTDEFYQAKTSDGHVFFTTGSAADTDLMVFNSATSFTRVVSKTDGQHDRNAFVNSAGLVYYERNASGQGDLYLYDVDEDSSILISNHANQEAIQAVLPNGGVLFSRLGGATENDLYLYLNGLGVVQVGADVPALDTLDKTYVGQTSDNRVLFTAQVTGSNDDLYVWNPGTTSSTAIATSASNEVFHGVTAANKVIYTVEGAGSDYDVHSFATATNTDTDLSGTADQDVFQAVTSLDDVVIQRQTGGGNDDMFLWDESAGALDTMDTAGATAYVFDAVLANGSVVYSQAVGVGVRRYDAVAETAVTVAAMAYSYAGETSAGNFVLKITAGLQDDLHHWNEGTDTLEVVANSGQDDRFGVGLTGGPVLFFHNTLTTTNRDVYVWDATNGARRASATTVDHGFVDVFSALLP